MRAIIPGIGDIVLILRVKVTRTGKVIMKMINTGVLTEAPNHNMVDESTNVEVHKTTKTVGTIVDSPFHTMRNAGNDKKGGMIVITAKREYITLPR
jgi:hypothetical protein